MRFKFLATLICGAILLSSTLCMAAVDSSKIALGKIFPGMSEAELVNAYGQPSYRDGEDWIYGDFKVEVEYGVVEKVSTTSGNLATPNGVRVGQAATALNSTFGTADKIDRDYDDTEYEYYSNNSSKKIEFKVVNGIIVKITCKIRD